MNGFYLALLLAFFVTSCNSTDNNKKSTAVARCGSSKISDQDWFKSNKKAPLFDGLKGIDFKISTANEQAQRYFDQGMMLAYGFNHAEAARSFYESSRLDNNCAMAYWGYAYVLGPNYNGGMESDNYERAYNSTKKAQSLSKNCSPVEIALIDALTTRYAAQAPKDRSTLDNDYANAMERVYVQYPTNPDVAALYADALLNLHPWDLYENNSKQPKPWTAKIVSLLEKLIHEYPMHPAAHHFYIHAVEASATPEKALHSAKVLDALVPSSGHLLHMPSHIYINTGDYHLATLSNLRAIHVDSLYQSACHAYGVYPLAYYPHNYHFLAATASLEGNATLAWKAAQKLQALTATDIMDQPEWGTLQHYYSIPYYIAVKFNLWDSILALPPPVKNLTYPKAIWHYARAMAYLGKNKLSLAQKEAHMLYTLSQDSSLVHLSVWNINNMADLTQIACKTMRAALALKQEHTASAIQLLHEAIVQEDQLNYNEPPDWFFSVRHHLGAVLLRTGQHAEAEKIYKQDLEKWKKNGWALLGLHQALIGQHKIAEAGQVKILFDTAWKHANIALSASSEIFK